MSKIRIKNFGPIKEGYQEDDGWMDIKKVTVFIGNQGSGKSTVAKVISTMTWIEKALNRGDIPALESQNDLQKQFNYQGLKSYFKDDTTIEYYGDCYTILYNTKENHYTQTIKNPTGIYTVPKIMYVPDGRSFLSVIKTATSVRGLPEPLFEFAEELRSSQNNYKDKEILLPINDNVRYLYDSQSDTSYIIGNDYKVDLLIASSGFQSLVPLYLVSLSLATTIYDGAEISPETISVDQSIRMNKEISAIMLNKQLSIEKRQKQVNEVEARFLNKAFINIVEEPEQNLYPKSQQQLLNRLLAFNNMNEGNKLIMTTHSPYLINYITLAVEAARLKEKVLTGDLQQKMEKIVPLNSTINPTDLVIYQLEELDGTINLLPNYMGLPSDENKLNDELGQGNEDFAKLLEIAQKL